MFQQNEQGELQGALTSLNEPDDDFRASIMNNLFKLFHNRKIIHSIFLAPLSLLGAVFMVGSIVISYGCALRNEKHAVA